MHVQPQLRESNETKFSVGNKSDNYDTEPVGEMKSLNLNYKVIFRSSL